jgi:hypothetical protein
MFRIIALTYLFTASVLAAAVGNKTESAWPMRDRVYCSPEQGIAFRYPYTWRPIDQYSGVLVSEGQRLGIMADKRIVVADSAGKVDRPRVAVFSMTVAEAPDPSLDKVGEAQTKGTITWQPFDYYRVAPERPQADPKWAPKGIEARLGQGAEACVLVLKHGDRISGLVLKGAPDQAENRSIIDSFEVLVGAWSKTASKSKNAPHPTSWREKQWRDNSVIASDGKLVKAAGSMKQAPVPWPKAWEIETEHYHIMGNTSPARLVFQGAYFEGLYRAYSQLYEPERMPPFKFEVHIFDTNDQFKSAAGAWGHNVPSGSGGIVGGFFVSQLLSLWVFEEAGRLGNPDFTVERVSAHECSHQFLHVTCNGSNHVPTWINEGLAVYFESGVFQGGEFQVRSPRQRIEQLKAHYQKASGGGTLMPLDQYLDHHGHIDTAQYAEVFAMTHFWIFGTCEGPGCRHKKCGLARFREYWQALKKGEDGKLAFERIFMADMIKAKGSRENAIAEWTKLLRQYVLQKLR